MINEYQIKAGINRSDEEELKALSIYLQSVEGMNTSACQQLNEVIENDPRLLFEPRRIDKDTSFPMKDLAFLHRGKEIIGHLFHVFNRENTDFGYKTSAQLVEEYSFCNLPTNYYDNYIINRLKGNLEFGFKENEKNNQK